MTIGTRLQTARLRAGLTQEQAAEKLNVSRQTISNWENDTTLPDVAYAKEISQVYGISLDALISGAAPERCQETVPTPVRTNDNIGKALLLCYFVLWMSCVFFFWIFGSGGGFPMLYALFIYGLLFHVASGVIAFLLGLFDCWPVKRYFLVFLFGVGQVLLLYVIYSLANTISSSFL